MLAAGRDELFCDFAETYHMIGWQGLSAKAVATLAFGLPEDSRIKRKLAGVRVRSQTALLAAAIDRLGQIAWMLSDDGRHGRNRPASVYDALTAAPRERVTAYSTPAEFHAAWAAATGGGP